MSTTIAPLLGALFLVLAVGVALRAFARMGQAQADALNALIVDVTMPALIISVLSKRDLEWSSAISLLPGPSRWSLRPSSPSRRFCASSSCT